MIGAILPIIGVTAAIIAFLYVVGTRINPSDKAYRLLEKLIIGGILLYIWNWISKPLDLTLGINLITALVAGLLGGPGLALLLTIRMMS